MLEACGFFVVFDSLTKYLSNSFSLAEIGFARFGFGLLVTFPSLVHRKVQPNKRDLMLLILRGLLGVGVFYAVIEAYRVISLSVTMVLFYTNPVWALLMGMYFLREHITWERGLGVIAALIGIVFLTNPWKSGIETGHIYSLMAGVMVGGNSVATRHLRERYDSRFIYAFQCLVGTLFCLPLIANSAHFPHCTSLILLLVAATFGLLAQVTMNYGYKFVPAAEGATLMMGEAVFASAAGILIFQEPLTLEFLAGAVMVVGSGVYLGLHTTGKLAY
jgi:drug/metabolite transporter (DMT)-like permease